jgi:hypothetical protein
MRRQPADRPMGKRHHVYSGLGRMRPASYGGGAARRRLQRIRFRDSTPIEVWMLLIVLIVIILMAPKLAELHDEIHHPRAHQSQKNASP